MERIFTDDRCLEHTTPPGYPERPERLHSVLAVLAGAGLDIERGPFRVDVRPVIEALHDQDYVGRFERAVARGDGLLDSADNPISKGTWRAAWAAAETAAAAAAWTAAGSGRRAFAAVRPPGHHAERETAMGFCFFGNVSVAAEYLLREAGLTRVTIVDFDVHHGNGTQHLFEARSDVTVINLHQFPFYPGTGAASEVGVGDGEGHTFNVPMPVGSGDADYRRTFDEHVVPVLAQSRPEVLLVSAGFDAWRDDPLGGMEVTTDGFRAWGRLLRAAADRHANGRLFSILEGGYDVPRLGHLVEAYLAGTRQG